MLEAVDRSRLSDQIAPSRLTDSVIRTQSVGRVEVFCERQSHETEWSLVGLSRSLRKSSRKSSLEIQHSDPFRYEGCARPLPTLGADMFDPCFPFFRPEISFRSLCPLRHYAVHRANVCRAANQQHLMGKVLTSIVTGALGFCVKDSVSVPSASPRPAGSQLPSVPMKPDGQDARGTVGRDVCQTRRNVRRQKLLGQGGLEQCKISLLQSHTASFLGEQT